MIFFSEVVTVGGGNVGLVEMRMFHTSVGGEDKTKLVFLEGSCWKII